MRSPRALPPPDHPSYQRHKRQLWAQILLPIIVAALIFAALTYLTLRAAFETGGDVARWAAISTIWLVLPVMVGGLLLLSILGAAIFMLTNVPGFILPYSYQAQRTFYRIEYGTKRLAMMIHRPILLAQGMLSMVKSGIDKAWERIW